jgi:predicted MFS family arabinose efflux permease
MTAAGAGAASLAPAYDASLLLVGLMTTALAATYATLQLPAGLLVDRIGVRSASVLGLTVVVLVHVVACATPLTWLALACRALAGAGYAVCFVSGAELVRLSGWGPSGIGLFGGVSLATSGVAVLSVPFAEHVCGWRAAWVTSGAVALLALLMVARLRVPSPVPAPAPPPRATASSPGPSLLRDGELHRLAAVHAVTLGLGVVLSNWAAVVLVDTWDFGRTAAAVTGSLVLGTSVISRPLGGYLVRRIPHRTAQVSAISLAGCSLATAALALPTVSVVAVVAVLVLGLLSGLPFAAVITAGQVRHPDRPAAAVGLLNSQANALILTGAPLLGAAIEWGRTSMALWLAAVLWLLPLLARPRTAGRDPADDPAPCSAVASVDHR